MRTTTALIALLMAATTMILASTARSDTPVANVTCKAGERATHGSGEHGFDERLLVLGCVELPDGDRLQVEGWSTRIGGVRTSCFSLTYEPNPAGSFACPRRPPGAKAARLYLLLQPRSGEPVLAFGVAPTRTEHIVAESTSTKGPALSVDADVLRVADTLGRRVAAARGFEIFVAPFPSDIDACAHIVLRSTDRSGDASTTRAPAPHRSGFLGLTNGGWLAGLTPSWGIGNGSPKSCPPPDPAISIGLAPL